MWEELYRSTYRYFLSLGLAREDAEDLAQETLLATYLHLDGIQCGKLRAYVMVTAKAKYCDFLRRQRARPLLSGEEGLKTASSDRQAEELGVGETAAVVAALNPTERRIIFLKYQIGLSMKEIAALLGTSAESVKTRLWRARKKLRTRVEEDG